MSVLSQLIEHPSYAEDQRWSHFVLISHVLERGFQSGALFGAIYGAGRHLYLRRSPSKQPPFNVRVFRSMGVGSAVGVGLMTLGLSARMLGQEHIEWQDRAWRLLENQGQVECDRYSAAGAATVAAVGISRQGLNPANWRMLVGGAGFGSLLGIAGYMIYRHGIKRGQWEEAAEKVVEQINPGMPLESQKK